MKYTIFYQTFNNKEANDLFSTAEIEAASDKSAVRLARKVISTRFFIVRQHGPVQPDSCTYGRWVEAKKR